MRMPWISIAGLIEEDPTLFDNLVLPAAADYADIADWIVAHPFIPDKSTLVNYMLFQLAELPVVYSDPTFLKTMIGYWSAAKKPYWVELWRTMLYAYNPIWNKDGEIHEERTIEFSKDGATTDTGTVTTDQDTTDTGTVSRSGSSSGSTEHQVTGYDTNTYSPDTRDLTSGSASETTTNNLAGSNDATETRNLAGTSDESGTSSDIFDRTEKGNIGVTTTQQMIKEQREIAMSFYDFVVQEFKKEFCVMIW